MQLFNIIILWTILGYLVSYLAKKRGRDPVAWFVIGLLLGIFGILLVVILPNRCRKRPIAPHLLPPQRGEAWLKMWYYLDPTHTQKGPIEFLDLAKLLKEKKLSERSFIWGEGMKEWKRLAEMPELIQEMDRS